MKNKLILFFILLFTIYTLLKILQFVGIINNINISINHNSYGFYLIIFLITIIIGLLFYKFNC